MEVEPKEIETHIWGIAEDQIAKYESLYEELLEDYNRNGNFVYVIIPKGQKEGSIAKLVSDSPPTFESSRIWQRRRANSPEKYTISISYAGILRWDGRSNKPKGSISEVKWLQGYTGKTVWKSVSATDKKEQALKNPIYDINKNKLSVGDSVVYINARYGSGMTLCFGTIARFEAEYHKHNNTTSVYTIVTHKDYPSQESKVSNPSEFIYKINNEV